MKILLVNKFHYFRGGSEKYYFELAELLKKHGHEVGFFSMKNENNITTGDKEYFVEETDLNNGSKLKAFDIIYSPANKKMMKKALEEFKPDIVHINNFQRQLSASIVKAVKEKNIPLVMTAHDENAVCPANIMLCRGEICEDCLTKGYMSCIKKSCVKDSKLKSILGVMENKFYRMFKIFKDFDIILAPSNFVKTKLIQGRLAYKRIEVLPNFVNSQDKKDNPVGDYALFAGRLSAEKGILNLVDAITKVENGKLLIAGDGPERENIENRIKENNLQDKIKLLGYLSQEQVRHYIENSRFVAIPSVSYENCPYTVLETMEIGKPIVGSRTGGVPELIRDNENGLLFEKNDVDELSEKMRILFENDELAIAMGNKSRELFEENYSSEAYYEKLMKLYESILK